MTWVRSIIHYIKGRPLNLMKFIDMPNLIQCANNTFLYNKVCELCVGIVSGAILQLKEEFNLDCQQQELVVSSMLFGALLGSLTGGQCLAILFYFQHLYACFNIWYSY